METLKCRTCLENKYDARKSTSFQTNPTGTVTELGYGSLYTKGYEALETVCFTSDSTYCASSFTWFAITF